MDLFSLENKRAFVTGRAGLLAPIWRETLEQYGCEVMSYGLPEDDVRDRDKLKGIATVFTPDIIVNNAAIDDPPGTKTSFFADCSKIMDVSLLGAVNVSEAFIPGMIENGGGVIINIGSIQGLVGTDLRNYPVGFVKPVGYNLSKAGLIQLSRSITTQYGEGGVRCVTIAFGAVKGNKLKSEFLDKFLKNVPTHLLVTENDLKRALLFACCCESFAGQTVVVDGGYTIL